MALLFSFDFDGTLVDHGAQPEFEPAMRDRLQRERRRGGIFVINTGRSLGDTINGIADHGLLIAPDFIIARERDIYINKAGRWKNFGPWNKAAKKAHRLFVAEHRNFFSHLEEQVHQHTKARFLRDDNEDTGIVASTEEELSGIVTYLEQHQDRFPNLGWQRNGIYLRFMPVNHSKGSALRELGRLLALSPDRLFAGGDNFNDLSMLRPDIAAHLACPANAVPEVKRHILSHGGFVGQKNASAGMLEALNHFFPEGA